MPTETPEQLRDKALASSSIEEKVAIARQLGATDEDLQGTLGRFGGYEQYYNQPVQEEMPLEMQPPSTYNFDVATVDVTSNEEPQTSTLPSLYQSPPAQIYGLFDIASVENKDNLARINAVALSVLNSNTSSPANPVSFFNNEYYSMEGASFEYQNAHLNRRVGEIAGYDFQNELSRIVSAYRADLLGMRGGQPQQPGQLTVEQQVEQVVSRQQATTEAVQTTDGPISVLTAISAYRREDEPTAKAAIERKWNDYLMYSTLEALGHDADLLSLEMVDDWLKQFVPSRFNYEIFRYGGVLDQFEFDALPTEEKMQFSARVAQQLIAANAEPLTVMAALDRFRSDRSLLSGKAATTVFAGLDLLAVGAAVKYASMATRWAEKIAILRKMKNAPGAAAVFGDSRTAGALNAGALLGDDASRLALGVDRTTAGMNASPFRFTSLSTEATDGVSDATIRFIDEERRVLNYKLNQAVSPESTSSTGFLRESEREAAKSIVLSRLPSTAEVVESTPFGVTVRMVTTNNAKFANAEELAAAERRYDAWREAYEQASEAEDIFFSQVGRFDPDPATVNRLEAARQSAKLEMEEAYRVLTRGIEPDKVEEATVYYTRSMLDGTFDGVLDGGNILPNLLSPTTIFSNLDSLIVAEKTAILAQQSKLRNLYKKLMGDALVNLSSKEAKNVDAVLLHGDDLGVKFTAGELTRGVDIPGLGTVRLTGKKELAAYFKARDVFDSMHGVHNITKYRRFKFENYRMTSILIDDGSGAIGAPRKLYVRDAVTTSTASDGSTVVRVPAVAEILDARNANSPAKAVKFSGGFKDEITKLVQQGKAWIVQFEKPMRIGDNMYNYTIVRPSRLKELDMNIVPYRTGYVPRIYEAVPYVVRQSRKVKVDGTAASKPLYTTERFFMTRSEGEAWAAGETRRDGVARIVDTDANWRATDKTYAEEANDAVRSGLYETERGEAIPFGTLGEEAQRSSAFASMDRYLGNLAYTMPLNEWRQSVVQRYFNTVNRHIVNENEFGHLTNRDTGFKPGVTEATKEAIINAGKYLQEQIGLAGPGERAFTRLAQNVADSMENSLFWKAIGKVSPALHDKAKLKLLYGADNVDAYGWLRNAAFRVYLGFFSIPQLYVQASNMVTVASLHPINSLSVIRRILSLRSVAHLEVSNPNYEKIVGIAAKAGLMRYDDFEPLVRSWIKSGLYYSTRINADSAMASRGISPGGDLARVSNFVDEALMFPYQEGELWSRMYAYLDSATRLRKAGVNITSTDGVRAITDETFKVAFNYTQANKARWQKGAWSIPTQFLQAPVKFYEAMLAPTNGKYAGQFTKMERLRLALGQIILFGTAGIPFAGFMRDQITNWMRTPSSDGGSSLYPDIPREQLELITGGVADYTASILASAVSGTDVSLAVAERASLGGGLNLTLATLTAEDASIPKAVLGAAGGVLLQRAIPALEHIARAHGTEIGADTADGHSLLGVLDKLGTITSTWSNIHRARLWYNANAMVNRYGEEMMPLDRDEDFGIILFKGLGFRSYEEIAQYRIKDFNDKSDPQKEIQDALRSAQTVLLEYVDGGYLTSSGKDSYSAQILFLKRSLKDQASQDEFTKQWGELLMNGTSKAAKEYRKLIDRLAVYDSETIGTVPADFGVINDRTSTEVLEANTERR